VKGRGMDPETSTMASPPAGRQIVRVRADSGPLTRYAVGGAAGVVELQFLRVVPPSLGRYAAGATSIWYHHASPPYPDSEPSQCDLQDGRPCYPDAGTPSRARELHDAWCTAGCDDETIWAALEELYGTGLTAGQAPRSPSVPQGALEL
jgi:hypothetical protein